VVLSNGTLWSNKSGSIKERTQKNTEICTGCQRNAYWLATNHLLGRSLCSQSRSCRLRQGGVPEMGFALIRQLANEAGVVFGLSVCLYVCLSVQKKLKYYRSEIYVTHKCVMVKPKVMRYW